MREVTLIVLEYSKKIHAKADRSDPNFIRISVACGKVCYFPLSSWIAELTSLPQIEEYCDKYCVEKFSTMETSMSELMMYIGAAFILVLVIGLNYTSSM